MPTIALIFPLPLPLMSEMLTFRPPASIKPWPSAAPNRAIGSSCLSEMILWYSERVVEREGEDASDC